MSHIGFLIDLTGCTGCSACEVSCKDKNDLPVGPRPMRVLRRELGVFPDARSCFIPVPCYHCRWPSCVEMCKPGALFKREDDGIVALDRDRCNGCRRCVPACPYGAIQYLMSTRKVAKCDLCLDRLEKGLDPACVSGCTMRSMECGDIDELEKRPGVTRSLLGMPDPRMTWPAVVFVAPPAFVDPAGPPLHLKRSEREALRERLRRRAVVYKFLAQAFAMPPSADVLAYLTENELFAHFPVALTSPLAREALSLLSRACAASNCDELRRDFTQLFVGPDKLPSPPWESPHITGNPMLSGRPMLAVRRQYRRHHLAVTSMNTEPDDHVSAELAFVAQLCENTVRALDQQADTVWLSVLWAERTFLADHLLRWVPAFAKEATAAAKTDFFRAMATLAAEFLSSDHAALSCRPWHVGPSPIEVPRPSSRGAR